MGKKAIKRRRAKFAKKVINGSMTVAEAWNRMDRAEQGRRARLARQVSKSAGSTRAAPATEYQPGREAEFMHSAFRPMAPPPQPTTIQKARQTAFDRQYDQAVAPIREFIAKARGSAAVPLAPAPAPGLVVKQLSQPERAMVAEFRRFAAVTDDPFKREYYSDQIARITGETFTWGVL